MNNNLLKEDSTMGNLFSFLTDLAVNPKQQLAFANTPDTVMKVAGLSELEQTLLKSGNNAVAASFADELFQAAFVTGDPNPDPLPDPDPLSGKANYFVHQYA
jgi:hypothetical protein